MPGDKPAGTTYNIQVAVKDLADQTTNADYSLVIASGVIPIFIFDGGVADGKPDVIADLSLPALVPLGSMEHRLPNAEEVASAREQFVLTAVISPGSTGKLETHAVPDHATLTTQGHELPSTYALPDGLAFAGTGQERFKRYLTGTPTAAAVGVYDMTYIVSNKWGKTATQSFKLTVLANEPPVFSQAARDSVQPSYTQFSNTPFTSLVLPVATGGEGDGALTYSLTTTAESGTAANIVSNLPVGMSFNAGSRTLSGTPTAADSYSLTWAADDTDSNMASSDTATIEFKLVVDVDVPPTLVSTSAISASGKRNQQLATITLPVADGGNYGLTDTLGGKHNQVAIRLNSNGVISVAVVESGSRVYRSSGLTFNKRTSSSAATITGTPVIAGTYALFYSVADGDDNTAAGDTVTVAVTLTVTEPALAGGGVADGAAVVLKQDVLMSTAITLPRVASGASAAANISYTLQSSQTVDSSGAAIGSPTTATVAGGAAALPGLTYVAATGMNAGTLSGTPTAAGTWTLTYEAVDTLGTASTTDDLTTSISFTVQVILDTPLAFESTRKDALSGETFSYRIASSVGTFALPSVIGGVGSITKRLETTCIQEVKVKVEDPQKGEVEMEVEVVCADDAVTTGSNPAPKGLTFSNTGDTTAALTGSFERAGAYTVKYTVTDTAIANGAYQTPDTTSTVIVLFTLVVNPDLPPVLDPSGRISASGLVGRAVEITLPEATRGNDGLTDSLSGTHRPVGTGATATAVTVDATSGAISLSGGSASGLTFNKRTASARATITGRPTVTGSFSLRYKVVDGDDNEVNCIGVSTNDPSGCDTVTLEVLLRVENPTLTLSGGVAHLAAVVLKQGVALSVADIILPRVTAGASAPANISYELSASQTVESDGDKIDSPTVAPVATTAAAAPAGLTYAADDGTNAGKLSGTPTTAGTWMLTYKVTDSKGDSDGGNDVVEVISFTVAVVADSDPVLAAAREMELSDVTFDYVTGVSVGADADTAFELPAIIGGKLPAITGGKGNGAITESLMTFCSGSTCDIDAVTAGSTPEGLIFVASSDTAPAGLTGTFVSPGIYTVTYKVVDTPIPVTRAYQLADTSGDNNDGVDSDKVIFKLAVVADVRPTLASIEEIEDGTKDLQLTTITLPVASPGNDILTDSLSGLTDSLSGTYTADTTGGASPTITTIGVKSDGTILTDGTDDTTDSGLVFAGRTGIGAGSVATITGTPGVAGTFALTYTVVDDDTNEVPCTGATPPANCDTATVSVPLTVQYPEAAKIKVPGPDGTPIDKARDVSVPRNTSKTVDLYDYFNPRGGLDFDVISGNPDLLTVSEAGGVLTLTATQFGGTFTVTVTANNAATTTALSVPFTVTVIPNNPPVFVKGNIETLSKGLTVDESVTVALGNYFSDANGDILEYELVDADADSPDTHTYQQTIGGTLTDVLTATLSGANLTLTAKAVKTKAGTDVPIKVRATETGGNFVEDTFYASVTNTVPTTVGTIPGQQAVIGKPTVLSTLTLADYFSDEETLDVNLSFSASSSDTTVVSAAMVDPTSRILSLTVPDGVADKATAIIAVTATDMSGKTATQTFVATAALRPAFASETYSADLAENAVGSTTPVMVTDLTVSGSTDAKRYTLVSVDGATSGTDFGKFAVAAKTVATATTAVVTYKGAGEDYETLKAASTPNEPTFVLVIGVTDGTNMLEATKNTTLTVTVIDANDAPTFDSQNPTAATLLEQLAGDNADRTPSTNDDPRLLTTLTFEEQDVTDTSLTYSIVSVVSVPPSSLGVGSFSVAPKLGRPLKAELSFVGAKTVIKYGTDPGEEVESFTVKVSASDDGGAQVEQDVTVTVQENVAPTVVAIEKDGSLMPGGSLTLNATVTDTNIAADDILSYVWTVERATAVSGSTAVVGDITDLTSTLTSTGTSASLTVPTKPAGTTYDIRLAVTDLVNAAVTKVYSLEIVSAAAPALGSVSGQEFRAQLDIAPPLTLPVATGGTLVGSETLTYSLTAMVASESTTTGKVTNGLPDGLAFDATPANRTLSGKPTAAAVGVYDMTYKVVDSVNESSMRMFKLTVTANHAPVFSAGTGTDNIETKWSKGLTVASADVVPLGDYFTDADTGDSATLSYKLVDSSDSSNPEKDTITYQQSSTDVLTATISGADLTLTGEAKTSTDVSITVRATDTGGNSVDGTFAATVTNTLPTAVGSGIGDQTLAIGEITELTLTPYFTDTETSDANLSFSASSDTAAVVSAATVNSTSKVLSLTVPGTATDKATATITVTATDESGKSLAQTFTATAASRPAFAASSPTTATLAENAVGSTTAVMVTDLTVSGSTDAKSYTLVSVNGEGKDDGGTNYSKFAVDAKTGAEATTAEVTYKGALEDYETLKALLADCMPDVNEPLKCEPTFVLVITVTDSVNDLTANTTLTVAVTDVNEAPTYVSASQTPTSPILLERRPSNDADGMAADDDALLLATLTFDDQDGDSLTYSVASVASVVPAHSSSSVLAASDFLFTQTSTTPPKAQLSFVGDGSNIVYGTAAGEVQSFKVTVRASDGSEQVEQDVTITVQENVAPTVTVAATGDTSSKLGSTLTLEATPNDANITNGDILTYSWSVTGATPVDGSTAATTDITLSTPTAASTTLTVPTKPAGTKYDITVEVTDLIARTDSMGDSVVASATYELIIRPAGAPDLGSVSALSFPAQSAIATQTLPAASGGIDTLTYSLTAAIAASSTGMLANNLPDGLAFDSTASSDTFLQLSGEPTADAVGVYDMTYKVVDSVNESDTETFTLTVTANQPPVFSEAVEASYTILVSAVIPDSGLVLPAATSPEGKLEYDLTATSDSGATANIDGTDNLPVGLTFTKSTRTLTGTPTAVDTYTMTYTADDNDSNTDASDTTTATFKLKVETDVLPTLTPTTVADATGFTRRAVSITLPVAAGGNGGLTDSLSGTHDPDGSSATAVTVDATSGAISLSGDPAPASGLTFNQRTGDGSNKQATITGAPTMAGTFDLTYKVVDGDSDEVTVSVKLTVTDPVLSLTDGNVANSAAVVLKQGVALTVAPITLPQATGDLSNKANISYALTASRTVDSSGDSISSPTVASVADAAAALPGLTYAADDGTNAGKLSGTPSEAGTWTLTYTATDDNDTTPTADDVPASISFTVQVVTDSAPDLADTRETALSGQTLAYLNGDTVGADSTTAFALPGFTGGNAPVTEALTTVCLLSGSACASDAVTAGSNPVPKGLTFAASSGSNPAGLTGTFGSLGSYIVSYTLTDTAIANTTTYQTADIADVAPVTFTLLVETDAVPTLTSTTAVTKDGLKDRRLTTIDLPVAAGGNNGLTDSLSGMHTPVSGSATAVTVDMTAGSATFGDISLSGDPAPASGLTFNQRTGDGSSNVATITGTPRVTGTFVLEYKVVDGDSSEVSSDEVMVSVTLTVAEPTLALTGGVANDAAVVLKQSLALTVAPIVLPRVTSGASDPANISYVLTASQTVDSDGATIDSPVTATVADTAAVAGLTYAVDDGTNAGKLSGTPSAVGTWTLTYTATDDNDTTPTADDATDSISFTVQVVADSAPDLADAREMALNGETFTYLNGDAVSAFALPGFTGGNGPVTESLTTACALSGGCAADAVTTGSYPAPKGLTFTASAAGGATPASLAGTFGSLGTYTVTYRVTDTAIGNSATYQTADIADFAPVTFTLLVETDAVPTLTPTTAVTEDGLKDRRLTTIDLPVAGGGNNGLTDSLSGDHTPVNGSATAVTVDMTAGEMFGAISLSDATATGLTFNQRTGDGSSNVATITGTPRVTGTFVLEYKVVDGDSNEVECTSANTPSGCDTVMVSVTLTVAAPTLALTGDLADDADLVLEQSAALSSPIVLPRVTSGASAPANISYVLTSTQMADGSGAAPVADTAAALPGLTYAEDTGSTAGRLLGAPSAVGTWALTYTATDNNGSAAAADDATDSISFTVEVVADGAPDLADTRETALKGKSFDYVTGGTVGVDASTAFALPAFTGGNGTRTESLATTCAVSGGTCAADAVTTGSNPAPKGLTFAASSGATPAGLTGTFGSPGTYTVTYSVTDTAIANGTYQTADTADVAEVEFTLAVVANMVPSLASTSPISQPGLTTRAVAITLPVASGGDSGLTDSLSGDHTPDSGSATAVTVAANGAISLSDSTATGLTFNQRTGDGSSNAATIEGTLAVTGTFALIYKVVDGDSNKTSGDEVMVSVTLTVTEPALTLAGGNVADSAAVVLEQALELTVAPITLPRVTSGASDPANISYALTASRTVDSSGDSISSPTVAPVADAAAALPGLTYAADDGTNAGKLSGTPSEAGTWTLTYTATDDNGTTTGATPTADDVPASISFTVQVVTDSVPTLDDTRKTALNGRTFAYPSGDTVGVDSSTAFAMPAITGGNGTRTESVATACVPLQGGSCTGAVTAGSNPVPTGLTFAMSSGSSPAGLTGTFGNLGSYIVTYTVTDTAIANTATYQPMDIVDTDSVVFTLLVETDKVPTLTPATAVTANGVKDRNLTAIDLPVASGGNNGLTDSLSGTHTPISGSATAVTVDATSGAISLSDSTAHPA